MGTFAKRLGQLAAKSLETESAAILKTSRANKTGLSKLLDGTLRQGHDMKTFGLGTAASLSSRERYGRFTASMHAAYDAMESEFDAAVEADSSSVGAQFWRAHGPTLRRADRLALDLADVGIDVGREPPPLSPATARYVAAIREAGADDRAANGGRLLGHAYCRYLADLFGGQMLGRPTWAALRLPEPPRHYVFDGDRRALIESVYESLNEAGTTLEATGADDRGGEDRLAAPVDEALHAFRLNADVYGEEPMVADAVVGALRAASGLVLRAGR
jgi:heme oxygenase